MKKTSSSQKKKKKAGRLRKFWGYIRVTESSKNLNRDRPAGLEPDTGLGGTGRRFMWEGMKCQQKKKSGKRYKARENGPVVEETEKELPWKREKKRGEREKKKSPPYQKEKFQSQ